MKTVLLIDDSPYHAELIQKAIEASGHCVMPYQRVTRGMFELERLGEKAIDLILIHYTNEDVDGRGCRNFLLGLRRRSPEDPSGHPMLYYTLAQCLAVSIPCAVITAGDPRECRIPSGLHNVEVGRAHVIVRNVGSVLNEAEKTGKIDLQSLVGRIYSLLCVGFDYDVERQLEDAGFRVCSAGVGDEGLDDWKRRVHDLLLIAPFLQKEYGEEKTAKASEQLEREAKEAVPDRKEFVVRILPEHGNDVGYILGEINKRVTRE